MTLLTDLNELCWHDAVLTAINIHRGTEGARYELELSLNVYPFPDAKMRVPASIQCRGVARSTIAVDFSELLDNASAGNISNLYVKQAGNGGLCFTLWAYLSDGLLEVTADSFECRLLSTQL